MPNELTTKQIEEIAFAVLRSHNDDRLWRALTYDSGPYDVTKATLALQDLASAFFRAGIASAPAAPAQAVPLTEDRIRHLWDKACRTVTVQGGGNDVLVFADYLTRELRGIAPKAAQPQEKT